MRPTRNIWFYIRLAFTLNPRIAWSLWQLERLKHRVLGRVIK